LHPKYRVQTPLDATLLKAKAGTDQFISEKYADEIGAILARWTSGLKQSPRSLAAIEEAFATDFIGASPTAVATRCVRSGLFESRFCRSSLADVGRAVEPRSGTGIC